MRKDAARDGAKLLGVGQAAAMLGLTDAALRMAVYKGQVPARRFGSRIVFVRAEIEAFIENLPRRQVPAPPAA
jgi:excisionase family DNA binding protein